MAQTAEQIISYFKNMKFGKEDLGADQLIPILEGIERSSFAGSESNRVRVKQALFAAQRRLQTPWDIVEEQGWSAIVTITAIKTLGDCGLFKKWLEAGGNPTTTPELAKLCGTIDEVLLRRFLKQLAGQRLIMEGGEDGDTYSPTEFSLALGGPMFPLLYDWVLTLNVPCFTTFPQYAAETGYKNPTDNVNSPFAHWYGKGETLFSMLAQKPDVSHAFNNMMHFYSDSKTPWVDIYPTAERIVEGAKPDRALVVDLGGGVGQDIEKMRAKHPNVPAGSLILEDLPNVIVRAKVQAPIITQEIDFFKPQPVIGARIYFLHAVTHNWPDAKVVEILKNIATAMEKGYSKILLYDMVVAKKNAHPRVPLSDLTMMMSLAASERTEDTWYGIAREAGLSVTKIWNVPEAVESIIELDLP